MLLLSIQDSKGLQIFMRITDYVLSLRYGKTNMYIRIVSVAMLGGNYGTGDAYTERNSQYDVAGQ